MIHLERLPEPEILITKKEKWQAAFEKKKAEKPGIRPPSKQYGHEKIRQSLASMSNKKCFYCEQPLLETEAQVDHYLEVADHPELAFAWHNLYLACGQCNKRKLTNKVIPADECIDPCNPEHDPAKHLGFNGEQVIVLKGSDRGRKTIRKYSLDRDDLEILRMRWLQQFTRILLHVKDRQINEKRSGLTDSERTMLTAFKDPSRPYSLMMSWYLSEHGL